ncbi:hypothetical protein ACIRVF_08165 [Kitasatospora sp. NPDC101157]|uniref:hypothetical protein n=1 Tax=Kitasatospora sp. NPDC101157 TaxID=3364098 RepID=UPI00380A7F3E
MPDRSVTAATSDTTPPLPSRDTSTSTYPGSPRHHTVPATTRAPQPNGSPQ